MQGLLWTIVALAVAVAVGASLAERRRAGREGLARVGWVPWSGMMVAALFVAVGALALALH